MMFLRHILLLTRHLRIEEHLLLLRLLLLRLLLLRLLLLRLLLLPLLLRLRNPRVMEHNLPLREKNVTLDEYTNGVLYKVEREILLLKLENQQELYLIRDCLPITWQP